MDDAGLAALLADLAGDPPKAGLTDPDEAPELPAVPYVKSAASSGSWETIASCAVTRPRQTMLLV